MTPVLRTEGLTKRYGRHQALTDVTLTIPAGRVVGLVGPNGAGKSTLLNLASGMIAPTSGTIEVLGAQPAASAAQLARIGYVAQDTPVYSALSVADHLRLGARLNPSWDDRLAQQRIAQVGLDLAQKAGRLSGGQRAQLALTIAAAKRPELLIFDEPVASLDPLARRAFLQNLMEFVAELEVSVILSSHLLGDLERVCDHLIVLTASRVQLAGEVEDLLAAHYRLIGARGDLDALPAGIEVIQAEHTGRQTTLIVHDTTGTVPDLVPDAERLDLESMVLAYLTRAARVTAGAPVNSHADKPLETQR
jgi:ABC-2 type transport system ATP-binding protein